MATTTATITLSSSDLLSDELSLATTCTLTSAGNSTGLTGTNGLARKTTTSASQYTLFAAADYTDDKAHKVYLKNTETAAGLYFLISKFHPSVLQYHACSHFEYSPVLFLQHWHFWQDTFVPEYSTLLFLVLR